ncbi:protein of unknown function [Micropruina glycogenica]|uniref:Uncharacterized protein n=1 Tax=Micropruina glycogenica TaxID=75385 RepID=A0A2N9JCC2_9ACTN|nr:protein of unknown function [Micropruina glycogenica]
MAKSGKADASAALKSLDAQDAASALASFQKAKDEFGQARELLGPGWLQSIPWVGRQLAAADDLTTIGFEGSSAGAEISTILVSVPSSSGSDRLTQVIRAAHPHLEAALQSVVSVNDRAEGLSDAALVPPLADAVREAQGILEPMRPLLGRAEALLELERYLFSADHRFLVLAQNNAQLRPLRWVHRNLWPDLHGVLGVSPGEVRGRLQAAQGPQRPACARRHEQEAPALHSRQLVAGLSVHGKDHG